MVTDLLKRIIQYRREHQIATRLLFLILLVSSLFTILGTALQLFMDFRQDVFRIENHLRDIRNSHLDGISNSLWNMDDRQLRTLLKGIARHKDIKQLLIIGPDGEKIIELGMKSPPLPIVQELPIHFIDRRGNRIPLGTLIATASLEGTYERLEEKFFLILGTQAIKTFVVSAFILFIFQVLVTRNLETLATYARHLNLDHIGPPLALGRPPAADGAVMDELENVVDAINAMRSRLLAGLSQRKRDEVALYRSQQRLKELVFHGEAIREREKRHLASEVHDEIGSQLTKLKMDVSWLRKHPPAAPEDLDRQLGELSATLDRMSGTIRHLSLSLRPKILDEFGLTAALEWLVKETRRYGRIDCRWIAPPPEIELDDDYRTVLFRICQEALTNVTRHARARVATVFLGLEKSMITLEVGDDGRGIDAQHLEEKLETFGIDGMRERVQRLGGTFEINRRPEGGTLVRVRLTRPMTRE